MASDPDVIDFAAVREDVRAAQALAPTKPAAAKKGRGSAPPAAPPEPTGTAQGLPPDSPVIPLGVVQTGPDVVEFVYLDAMRQLIHRGARQHAQLDLVGMAGGDLAWLRQRWPRYGKPLADGRCPINGMDALGAAAALMAAAKACGPWRETERLRGPGAWSGHGDFVVCYHNGNRVLGYDAAGAETVLEPGLIDHLVYLATPPGPAPLPAGGDGVEAVRDLRRLLEAHWAWSRPALDPLLYLGLLGASIVGGALPWRPMHFLTGGAGSGKTTLREQVANAVLGVHRVSLAGGSEASLRREMGSGTLPVLLDELEAAEDDRRQQAILDLARDSASGGTITRAGDGGGVVHYTVRGVMHFAGIMLPAMSPAVLSRFIILSLRPLGERAMPVIDRERLGLTGRILRRRLLSRWVRLGARIEQYRAELREGGLFDARAADVYGIVLACAEVALCDDVEELPAADRQWSAMVREAVGAVAIERLTDEQALLHHLLSLTVQPFGGASAPISLGELVNRAAGRVVGEDEGAAQRAIGRYGLRVGTIEGGGQALAIANSHAGLTRLLTGTRWAGRAGSTSVWAQAARRAAEQAGGIECSRALSFGGAVSRAALIPLSACPLPDPLMASNADVWANTPGVGKE